jgi:hypothetical protein
MGLFPFHLDPSLQGAKVFPVLGFMLVWATQVMRGLLVCLVWLGKKSRYLLCGDPQSNKGLLHRGIHSFIHSFIQGEKKWKISTNTVIAVASIPDSSIRIQFIILNQNLTNCCYLVTWVKHPQYPHIEGHQNDLNPKYPMLRLNQGLWVHIQSFFFPPLQFHEVGGTCDPPQENLVPHKSP